MAHKLLLLDDDANALMRMTLCFEENNMGYALFQTTSPSMALEIASRMQPDLIITDWQMPKMSGLDFIRTLKQNSETSHILVIMATGVMTESIAMKEVLDAGAIDFIRKPIDSFELLARTGSALKLADSFRKIREDERVIVEKEAIIVKQKAEMLQIENEKQKNDLLLNALKLNQLSELNNQLINQLIELNKKSSPATARKIRDIINTYRYSAAEQTWEGLRTHFQNFHQDFYSNLNKVYPTLTLNEKKICGFLRLNMTTKEISTFTFQSVESIRKARIRLRKKLNLSESDELSTFLTNI